MKIFTFETIALIFLLNFNFISNNQDFQQITTEYQTKKKCLNITLNPTEHYISPDELQALYSNQIITNYDTESNSICFPFSQHFQECSTWILKQSEIQWINGTFNFFDLVHKIEYKLGEYERTQDQTYRVCIPKEELPLSEFLTAFDFWITLIGWIMSAISVFIAFIIYCLVSSNTIDLKPLRSHMASLFFAYSFLAASFASGKVKNDFMCYFLAVGKQFSVISATCWLNMVSFELWWQFRSHRFVKRPTFLFFKNLFQNIYGWGIPFIIITISIVLQVTKSSVLYPNYLEICSLNQYTVEAVLYYGPITLCVLLNLILFVLTTILLFRIRRYMSLGTGQIQLLCMSVKLMVVMGIPWCMEVIEWATATRPEFWVIANTIMSFQGVFLFYIYVFRNYVKLEMQKLATYHCCFCIAKRVAVTPFKKPFFIYDASSTVQSTETVV